MTTNLKDMQAEQQEGKNELTRRAAHPILGKTDYLEKRKELLGTGMPGHMTVEREIRTATVMLMQSKDLQAALPETFYVAVSIAINSGIGLGNGKGYLVAYKGNVSYVPGWKGLIDLVNRTSRASAWTGVVHKGDEFDYALGDSPFLTHKPGDNEDHKDITHYYAIGRVKGAEYPHIVVWSVPKVIKHLNFYNKVGAKHYAVKNDDNMEAYGRKVVLLQVIKYLPTSVELENAQAAEYANMSGKSAKVENTIDGNFVYVNEDDAEQPGEAEPIPRTDHQPAEQQQRPAARRAEAEDVDVREAVPALSEEAEKAAGMLRRAGTLNQLADASDVANDLEVSKAEREALGAIYKKRYAELQAEPAGAEQKTVTADSGPAKRTRRNTTAAPAAE